VAPQLLIDMPAEGAVRLLMLSLLEQLSVHTTPHLTVPRDFTRDTTPIARRGDAYRAAVNRLRECIALYDETLGLSISRKVRRRLRFIARLANGLHDVHLQLAWLARAASPGTAAGSESNGEPSDDARVSGQATLAALWLRDRLLRRHDRITLQLERVQEDARPLRRLAKRLGVYTTAIHLDEMRVSSSFSALTGQQLAIAIGPLRTAIADVRNGTDSRTLQRLRRTADRVVYLLEPVSTSVDADRLTHNARELRDGLERLRETSVVADALIAAGRRIGALHMMSRMRRTVWPCDGREEEARSSTLQNTTVLADEISPGLLSLAERLRDECTASFDHFSSGWIATSAEAFLVDTERVATALDGR
jgi:hypothetical protein